MASKITARALVVGISRYDFLAPLPQSVRHDVEDLASILRDPAACGYRDDAVDVLFDEDASLAGLRKALHLAASTISPEDPFLLYFSGHGDRVTSSAGDSSYLLASDSRLDGLDDTAMSAAELLSLMQAIPSRRQVVILDACHAGGVGTLKSGAEGRPQGIAKEGISLLGGRGRVVFASSRADEVSLILPGCRNSLFTGSILKALRGGAKDKGDGTIGVFDLFSFVSVDVPTHASQHPVFKADDVEDNFSIALHPGANSKAPKPKLKTVNGLATLFASLYPLGPTDSDIWSRAGGDISRLPLAGHGLARWYSSLQVVKRGGGGLTLSDLLEIATFDFPGNAELKEIDDAAI